MNFDLKPVLPEEDEIFIDNFLKKIKRMKGGRPSYNERNANIIRWHFYGYGISQIQRLIENPPTVTRIYIIIQRDTKDRVPALLSDEYYSKRRHNMDRLLIEGDKQNGEGN